MGRSWSRGGTELDVRVMAATSGANASNAPGILAFASVELAGFITLQSPTTFQCHDRLVQTRAMPAVRFGLGIFRGWCAGWQTLKPAPSRWEIEMRGATVIAALVVGCSALAFDTVPPTAFGWYRPNQSTILHGPGPRWWEREL